MDVFAGISIMYASILELCVIQVNWLDNVSTATALELAAVPSSWSSTLMMLENTSVGISFSHVLHFMLLILLSVPTVVKCNFEHNHPIGPEYNILYPENRHLSPGEEDSVKRLIESKSSPK